MKAQIRRQIGIYLVSFLAAAGLLAGANQGNAGPYTFIDLGNKNSAYGINNAGQVVGRSYAAGDFHATLWNGSTPTDLGTLGGSYSFGASLNNAGQVAGMSYATGNVISYATIWNGTTPTALGTLGGDYSYALGINDAGQVVGRSTTVGDVAGHATLWNGTAPTDLGTLGGTQSSAYGINNAGLVIGYAFTAGNIASHATLWNGTTPTDLGTLTGATGGSAALGINDVGQVVGDSSDLAGYDHATVWNGTTPTALGTLGGNFSAAYGINSAGRVVGVSRTATDAAFHATLWNGTIPTDLNSLLDANTISAGWELQQAFSINDNGWIIGDAFNSITNENHGFVLSVGAIPSPVPEPNSLSLALVGLAAVWFRSSGTGTVGAQRGQLRAALIRGIPIRSACFARFNKSTLPARLRQLLADQ